MRREELSRRRPIFTPIPGGIIREGRFQDLRHQDDLRTSERLCNLTVPYRVSRNSAIPSGFLSLALRPRVPIKEWNHTRERY